MRSLVYTAYGEPAEVLHLAETAKPRAPEGREVLIRVSHRVVHPGDLIGVRGGFRPLGSTVAPPAGGGRPGFEGAGVIEALGQEARDAFGLDVGMRVAFFPAAGAWSEYVLADADVVSPLPGEVSNLVGSQLHVAPMTAALLLRAVHAAGVRPRSEELVVLSAAGSSVARLAIEQLCRKGVEVLALVRRDAAAAELTALFPDLEVVSTEHGDWVSHAHALTAGRRIKVALDPVAGDLAAWLVELLADGGTYVSYGDLSRQKIAVPALTFSARGITMTGVSVPRWAALPRGVRQADVASVLSIAASRPELFEVAGTYRLEDVAEAVRHAERPAKSGAIVLTTD